MPKPNTTPVYQLATRQDDGVATVYLYGIIGQMPEYWLPKSEQTVEEISAISLVDALNKLEKTNEVINIRINSVGGSVYEGEAMVNAIRACRAEVHTYNDGMAASMAATIWLSGDVRHMARNAKLMIHSPVTSRSGHANDLREGAEMLDKMTEASAAGIAEMTGRTVKEITSQFFADQKDHWMSFQDVETLGFLSNQEETYEVAQGAPGNVEQTAYRELIKQFQAAPPRERKPSAFQRIRQMAGVANQVIIPEKPKAVSPQELRDAIAKGDISADQLAEINQEVADKAAAEAAANPGTPEHSAALADIVKMAATAAVTAAVKPLNDEIERLGKQVSQLGAKPGAAPAGLDAGADPNSAPSKDNAEAYQEYANAAQSGGNPFINPAIR